MTNMPKHISKRFYKAVSTEPVEGSHGIFLDGKGIRTPQGAVLFVPTEALAHAMAKEWDIQSKIIKPHTMPLTGLANTAIDRICNSRAAVIDEMVSYADSDLLCYRAEEPADLVEMQVTSWQPLLDWASDTYGAQMLITKGIMPIRQSEEVLTILRRIAEKEADFQLTSISSLTAACGSLIIALAIRNGQLDAEQAFDVSQLDETHQIEHWGEDYEARDRRDNLRNSISSMTQFLTLLES